MAYYGIIDLDTERNINWPILTLLARSLAQLFRFSVSLGASPSTDQTVIDIEMAISLNFIAAVFLYFLVFLFGILFYLFLFLSLYCLLLSFLFYFYCYVLPLSANTCSEATFRNVSPFLWGFAMRKMRQCELMMVILIVNRLKLELVRFT